MRIVAYFCSMLVTLVCVALLIELGFALFLPDEFRGYLVDVGDDQVKWSIGPYEPGRRSEGFNDPINVKKPEGTIRIVVAGASGTEGWLTAKPVYNKYRQNWGDKNLSSYSRSIEFILNSIADSSAKNVEVINLGIAAYNVTDVIRMLKDAKRLDPDLYLIQIGGNETWTAKRTDWSSYISDELPYLYSQLGYEILSDKQAGWGTLSTGGNAFNPLVLIESRPRPVHHQPVGRDEGIQQRLDTFNSELEGLSAFIDKSGIPALFLLPSQNLVDFAPFGSMAKPGTTDEELDELNRLLIEALADTSSSAREKFQRVLELDDGIAEANFRLGHIYLKEGNLELAAEHFWRANDRDIVLKRLPRPFHIASREFVEKNNYLHIDVLKFFNSQSDAGLAGSDLLDDDVHPSRSSQYLLATKIVDTFLAEGLISQADYSGDMARLPTYEDYNTATGFDADAEGVLAYLKAVHNYMTFARYRQRLAWEPVPERILNPIVDDLAIATAASPDDKQLYMGIIINLYLKREAEAMALADKLDCGASPERSADVFLSLPFAGRTIIGHMKTGLKNDLRALMESKGCRK